MDPREAQQVREHSALRSQQGRVGGGRGRGHRQQLRLHQRQLDEESENNI